MIALLAFLPIGIAARGIYILSRKDYKVKWKTEDWNMAQVLVMLWLILCVFHAFAMHGRPRLLQTHNMYYELIDAAIAFIVLYSGGFWRQK